MTVDQWIGVALLGWACGVVTRDVLMAWVEGRRIPPGRTAGARIESDGNSAHPSTFAIRYPTADEFLPKRGGDLTPSSPPRTPLSKTRCG